MELPKYVRIQGRETAWVTKKPVGVFALAWRRLRDNIFNEEDKDVFKEAEKWFNKNLPHPPFYGKNNDDANANTDGAITYFKNNANAKIMFEYLTPILELLDKYQVPYDIIYTNIEEYPDAYPHPCALTLYFMDDNKPLHVVVGTDGNYLWLITAYYPTLDKWESDYKTRKVVENQ